MKYTLTKTKVEKEEIELLPCPFCGSENLKPVHIDGSWGYSSSKDYIECKYCGARGSVSGDSMNKAIQKWNRRVEEN